MAPDYNRSETYEVSVTNVTDGDTLDVEFSDGTTEELRVIGIDAPETERNRRFERPQEWEGLEDPDYLAQWGENAKEYAKTELAEATVTVSFDENEPIRGEYDRLLMYVETPTEDDGQVRLYNRALIEEGFARVYGSSLTHHAEFWEAEDEARTSGVGLWAESNPEATTESRDRPVTDLFVPKPSSIRTDSGALVDDRVPVFAESTARQELQDRDHGVEYDRIPLVGTDTDARTGMIGGLLIDETYEKAEGFGMDTANFENFVFLTNLIDHLSDRSGSVLIDGGHGQFSVEYAITNEEAAYYQHYLEGQDGIGFEQVNEFTQARFADARAMIVSSPASPYTDTEVDLLTEFRDDGGAVVVLGSATASATARENLDDLVERLGSDLRLNEDQVFDATHKVNDDSSLPYTTAFDSSFPLFDAYSPESDSGNQGALSLAEIHANAAGDEYENLNDEYLVFTNPGNDTLDLTGSVVHDEAGHEYAFPEGVTLSPGEAVTLHTGSGSDDDAGLYWGASAPVWNNTGDEVIVTDPSGSAILSREY
ncbi:lamin tail domain-containing protein [Halococcus sp. PRR34]|uniref:lamin tail domain-containing protein n=1 Tax=Halococcus sp. PRR34 TaxID=3020830 RepID=UPI00235E7733|nr:lamin tail domain-containing protein [Halococcus sp. PRR34]